MYSYGGIKLILRKLGLKTTLCGYRYIVYGMMLLQKNPSYLDFITKTLYIDIAKKFQTSSVCVERAIRTAVSTIWKTNNLKLLYAISGNGFISRPSNKEFFGLFYRYLSQEEEERAVEKIFEDKDVDLYCDLTCDECGKTCEQLKKVYQEMIILSVENRKLKEQLDRIINYDAKIEREET